MPAPAKFGPDVQVESDAPQKFGADVSIETDNAPPAPGPLDRFAAWGAKTFPQLSPQDMKRPELQQYDAVRQHPAVTRFLTNAATVPARNLTSLPAAAVDAVTKAAWTPRQSAQRMAERNQGATPYDSSKPITGSDVSDYASDAVGGLVTGAIVSEIAGGLLGRGMSTEKNVGRMSFAAGKGSTAPIEATLNDLRSAAKTTNPTTVGGFLDTANAAKATLGKEFKDTLGSNATRAFDGSPIADRIESLITPNMVQTVEGKAKARALLAAAKEFRKTWTLEQLDAERMQRYADLGAYNKQLPVGRYNARMGSVNVAIDDTVNKAIKDTVYPIMDDLAGKPKGYFENLQIRRSNLIQLQNALDKQVVELHDTASRTRGAPRLSRAGLGGTVGETGAPRVFMHNLPAALHTPNVEAQADRAVRKGFRPAKSTWKSGEPVPSAIRSLPAKALITAGVASGLPAPRRVTATHPETGHKIAHNGTDWVDAETGASVAQQ